MFLKLIANKMKRTYSNLSFPFIILFSAILLVICFYWIKYRQISISTGIVVSIIALFMTSTNKVKILDNKIILAQYFLFIKYSECIYVVGDVKEIYIIKNKQNLKMMTFAPRSAGEKQIENNSFNLIIRDNTQKSLLIYSSIKPNMVYKLGNLFAKYYNVQIIEKSKTKDFPDKEMFQGFLPSSRTNE